MTLSTAISYFDDYVNGTKTNYDMDVLDAVEVLASYGHYTSIDEWNIMIGGRSVDIYDHYILAFCNYWYSKFSLKGYKYNPSYVKAMIGVETKMGTYEGSRHGTTDILQCLDKDNPAIYCMSKIKPSNGVLYSSTEGLSYGMKSSGYTVFKNLFNGSTPDSSHYDYFVSLCGGILWLGYKTALKGTIKDGITAYNGGGDSEYLNKVMKCYKNPSGFLL